VLYREENSLRVFRLSGHNQKFYKGQEYHVLFEMKIAKYCQANNIPECNKKAIREAM